tara:strand:- start:228 stop:407 length:180 start_codon:yes stop_codon:yes gene_type:complete
MNKNDFQSNQGKSFSQEEAIDLMVSLSATDTNSERKWRGFYNSLSKSELKAEWDEFWKN